MKLELENLIHSDGVCTDGTRAVGVVDTRTLSASPHVGRIHEIEQFETHMLGSAHRLDD